MMEFQVDVRKYGGRHTGSIGSVPRKLDEFIQVLQETRLEIPPEYRADARVDIEPENDTGVDLNCLHIYYHRPRTTEEIAADDAHLKSQWERQIMEAEKRIAFCRSELEKMTRDSC
jgi:hypothetical protein